MANKELLSVRKEMRKTKPAFVVRESNFSRIESRWRYPYGRHSKVRQMHCSKYRLCLIRDMARRKKCGVCIPPG